MVRGLEIFRNAFRDESDQYVLIGGVPTMYWLDRAALPARATKDLDIVLLIEAQRKGFQRKLWDFIKAGGYNNRQKSTGERIYYRFSHPSEENYPHMLELFSRVQGTFNLYDAPEIIPIPKDDDVSSLSAILMEDGYYQIVTNNISEEDGLPMLTPQGLILLKARAWLDLTERKEKGDRVDSRDVRKHRTDIFKLSQLLIPAETNAVAKTVLNDFHRFLDHFPEESPEWSGIAMAVGSKRKDFASAVLHILRNYFTAI